MLANLELATIALQVSTAVQANDQPAVQVVGPAADVKVIEAYVRMQAKDAYFWGWTMAKLCNLSAEIVLHHY
jgi:hypothetical protein